MKILVTGAAGFIGFHTCLKLIQQGHSVYRNGVVRIIEKNIDNRIHYKIYNIGNNKTVMLSEFISTIESALVKKAIKVMRPNQLGDVPKTWADITALKKDYGYNPSTDLSLGIPKFINWYRKFY